MPDHDHDPAADATRRSARAPWDESTRPLAPPPPENFEYREGSEAIGQHLVDVHNHLRNELETVLDLVEQVRAGALRPGEARSAINATTMRQNNWTLGAYCAAYCTVVTGHHGLEDAQVFPHLRRADPGLAPVMDRLQEEHAVIHDVLEGLDRALVDFIDSGSSADCPDFTGLDAALAVLADALLSHLAYEEQQIVEPLSRLGFYAGQV